LDVEKEDEEAEGVAISPWDDRRGDLCKQEYVEQTTRAFPHGTHPRRAKLKEVFWPRLVGPELG
jgi:hypothetical protein